jgi:GTP-binding protein Era
MSFKSGFVAITGKPNAGKSTLMNALLGTSLSAVTPKVQTTRHRIKGILNGPGYQIVFSDTPGIMVPAYTLHKRMMDAVEASVQDADLVLLIIDVHDKELQEEVRKYVSGLLVPLIVVLNKVDESDQQAVSDTIGYWNRTLNPKEVIPVSALHGFNLESLVKVILELLPEAPAYFDTEEISDRNIRFFTEELIRETILTRYEQEIPYSCEVTVTRYQQDKNIDRIYVEISVTRESQKAILLGHKGAAIKGLGTEARKKLEKLTGKKIYLDLTVKVRQDWRDDDQQLDRLGYRKDS